MNAFSASIQREIQQHRSGFLWLPLGAFGFFITLILLVLIAGNINFENVARTYDDERVASLFTEQGDLTASHALAYGLNLLDGFADDEKQAAFGVFRAACGYIFHVLFFLIAFFYLAGTLFDERSDRSILFWKSMPVSDWHAVLSKLLTVLLAVPVIYVLAIVATQLSLLLIVSIVGLFSSASITSLWLDSGLLGGWIHLVIGYLVQGFWMLPVYGWLLLVSAWTNRNPVLVAVLAPIIPIALEAVLFQTTYLSNWISSHFRWVALPGFSGVERSQMHTTDLSDALAVLASGDFYLGIFIGAALVAGAVWFRRANNEI